MIEIKTKTNFDKDFAFIKILKWKVEDTNTIEHLAIIQALIIEILENDKNISKEELFKLIKQNVNKDLKEKEKK